MATVDVATAAMLMNVSERHVRRLISEKRFEFSLESGKGGDHGLRYAIEVDSLSTAAQKRYAMMLDEKDNSGFDRGGYINRKGKEKEAELMERLDLIRECLTLMESKPEGLTLKVNALAEKNGISSSTLRAWVKKYEAGGLSEIASVSRSDKGSTRSICKWAQKMITDRVCQKNQPTNRAVYSELLEVAKETGKEACANCPYNEGTERRAVLISKGLIDPNDKCAMEYKAGLVVPIHYCTVDRYIKGLNESMLAYGRKGNKYWEARFMPKIRRDKPEKVNQIWFGDHHQFDVFVRTEDGKVMRPWATVWMDARSNCLVGTAISLNPNTDTIVRALDSAIYYKTDSPFYGLPEIIYIDNGKDYRSKRMEGAGGVGHNEESIGKLNLSLTEENGMLKTLGIGVVHALPYRGWSKTVERIFGTLERRYVQGVLPGWCGHNPTARPESLAEEIKKGALLTYEEFVIYFYTKMLPEYHKLQNTEGKSPLEIYESSERARDGMVPSRELMASFKLERASRKITPEGIRLKKEMYTASFLEPYIGETVLIAYNKEDDESISIYRKGIYIGEAGRQERFKMVFEDEERITKHMERQQGARKRIKRILLANKEIASLTGGIASETLDMSRKATFISMPHVIEDKKRAWEKGRIKEDKKWLEAKRANKNKIMQDYFTRKGEELLSSIG